MADRHLLRVYYGSQLRATGSKALVREFELEQVGISPYDPESTGNIERFRRSTREELREVELTNLGKARKIIGRLVAFYDQKRVLAGLKYLTPEDYREREPEKRLKERREKLARARKRREETNRARLQAAA